jgi:predicted regulator of Ras-like GTPase activity (Roadblock/LC7/MglB family)
MDAILQTLLDLGGVTATLVFDSAGQLLGHRGHSIYDRALCEQVSAALVRAIDAVQLQQEDWETIAAQFQDGKLLLRRIGAVGGRTQVLAVVADANLNPSFATVAIRVAAGKLRKLFEGGSASSPGGGSSPGLGSSPNLGSSPGLPAAAPPGASSSLLGGSSPGDSRPVLANSGLSWSKTSSVGLSRVQVADPAAGAFLSRAAKALAQAVGPIAKVYVEEAVRRIAPEAPFALGMASALVEDLAGQIEDPVDQKQFKATMAKG